MVRNWDLIRKILLKLEQQADSMANLMPDDIQGFSPEVVAYHYWLLAKADLIIGVDYSTANEINFVANTLTWQGHELLDKIRNESVWNSVKTTIKNKSLDLSLEAIKTALSTIIKSTL